MIYDCYRFSHPDDRGFIRQHPNICYVWWCRRSPGLLHHKFRAVTFSFNFFTWTFVWYVLPFYQTYNFIPRSQCEVKENRGNIKKRRRKAKESERKRQSHLKLKRKNKISFRTWAWGILLITRTVNDLI